ncbi:DNA-directed primase/polymerase protein-like isoform X1 [Anneissia japonica]|uniref:DNA-directed primase/polymerase protein-like isoform X1 n=1 Tax=Anneissia japonica TaxID=1529436 RepID=UPI001425597F|nr:DNA-directed primase/polymerase protein-like isoform X1 [Anneissia japonica]XP_033122327.1 DNA-directed primase/polymerase protein-like isoform X1 [Anneissia japonica]
MKKNVLFLIEYMDKYNSLSIAELRERRQIKWLKKLKTLQKVENDYKQFPLLPTYKPRLLDPVPLWLTFFRQKQAFEYVASHQQDVHVFAFEVDNHQSELKGQRKFCVTSYSQLWHVIKHSANHKKFVSFYEVIPEGATCKLYFDLEFDKEVNPEHDGKQMVQTLIKFVCSKLHSIFQVQANIKQVVVLDASTEKKFSHHLIFNLTDVAFKDNLHQGNFVHHICCKIRKVIQQQSENDDTENKDNDEPTTKKSKVDDFAKNDQLTDLLVKDSNGKEALFIDEGVYTKNRNFRLYKCCKLSKNNPLVEADDNEYKPALNKLTGLKHEHQLFLDSIISNVSYSPKMRILTHQGCNRDFKKSFDRVIDAGFDADNVEDIKEGYQKSPFPELDGFIMSKVNQGGIQGEIRRWTYYARGGIIVYDIVKNRWCENIGRQHKSNNIMIIADLKKTVFYQKCLDPECRAINYKSPDQEIPLEVFPSFDDLDDDELIKAADKYEAAQRTKKEGDNDGGIGDFLADDESDEFVEAVDVLEKSISEIC